MLFAVEGLSKKFGNIAALEDVSFSVLAGEMLGLIGPNGAGKSTLFECLAGVLPADSGAVLAAGRPAREHERRSLLFYVPDSIAPWSAQPVGWAFKVKIGFFAAVVLAGLAGAADLKVDISKEQVGKPPVIFEPIVGTWLVGQDGGDKVIMLDGRPCVASKDNPTKLLLQTARKLYGTSNEELMDNAKQFAYYPVALLKGVANFTNGTISIAAQEFFSMLSRTAIGWPSASMTRRTMSRCGNFTTGSGATSDLAIAKNHSRLTGIHGTN